jgi:hypothetical protein
VVVEFARCEANVVMPKDLHEFFGALLSPAWGGAAKWGSHPHARMSVLSVMSFVLVAVVLVSRCVLKASGRPFPERLLCYIACGLLVLVFFSASFDLYRDRRLGLLPRRKSWW